MTYKVVIHIRFVNQDKHRVEFDHQNEIVVTDIRDVSKDAMHTSSELLVRLDQRIADLTKITAKQQGMGYDDGDEQPN